MTRTTSDTDPAAHRPRRLARLIKPLIAIVVLAGGGGGAGWWLGHDAASAGAVAAPDVPELVPRTDADGEPVAVPTGGPARAASFDRRRYTATYHSIEAPFTSNLDQSASFVQLSLGVATYYDERVVTAIKSHEMPLRSAVLMRLSEEPEARIVTPEGKAELQRDLARIMNKVLVDRTGFGGIDNVYFTSFVVQ